MVRILFVCTGNICRSPMAEGVFRHMVDEAGLSGKLHVESAGTDAYHVGEPPDRRAVRVAGRHGISIERQRARLLTAKDYQDFDHIFAMDGGHYYELRQRAPAGHRACIEMFISEGDVQDPWYGDEKDFETAFMLVHDGAAALLKKIRKDHNL